MGFRWVSAIKSNPQLFRAGWLSGWRTDRVDESDDRGVFPGEDEGYSFVLLDCRTRSDYLNEFQRGI